MRRETTKRHRATECNDFAVKELNTAVSVYNIWEYGEVMLFRKLTVCPQLPYVHHLCAVRGHDERHFTLASACFTISLSLRQHLSAAPQSLPFASKSLGGAWGAWHVTHGQVCGTPLFVWLSGPACFSKPSGSLCSFSRDGTDLLAVFQILNATQWPNLMLLQWIAELKSCIRDVCTCPHWSSPLYFWLWLHKVVRHAA